MTTEHRIPQQGSEGERFLLEESRSHPGLFHTVDVEREFCSCPATVRCFHIKKHQCIYCDGMTAQMPVYPRLIPCSHCGGTGRV